MIWTSLDADAVRDALRQAGLEPAPAELRIESREDRWAVFLPDERMAWFPANAAGAGRLRTERRVLRLLAERCGFSAPRILFEAASGYDVRAPVSGVVDPWGLFERIKTDTALAKRIGASIGGILVEQHTRIAKVDVMPWLPTRTPWPEPAAWIRQRLPGVIDDVQLIGRIESVVRAYEAVRVDADDCVLVHGDLGLHNIAVDPATAGVRGVFDYDGAAWADRHHDFRYLVLHLPGEAVLQAALEVYEPTLGRSLDRDRLHLHNAACAIGFLANRHGVLAQQKHCGRTLVEDLAWVEGALARLYLG